MLIQIVEAHYKKMALQIVRQIEVRYLAQIIITLVILVEFLLIQIVVDRQVVVHSRVQVVAQIVVAVHSLVRVEDHEVVVDSPEVVVGEAAEAVVAVKKNSYYKL